MSEARPWFEEAFRGRYLRVYPHRDLASARSEVAGLVARGFGATGGRVLDLGCGFGRHTLALLEAGLEAFGVDLSQELLERSNRLTDAPPEGPRLRGRLARADARAVPFAAQTFDGVCLLFSSFGYFDDEENGRVAAEVARVLRPGGLALFDLMNAGRVRATLVPESRARRDGFELHERRRLTDGGRRVVKEVRLVDEAGDERRWHEDVRLYEPRELADLLSAHGLEPLRTEGDFDGAPFDRDSQRQIVWCRRVGEGPA